MRRRRHLKFGFKPPRTERAQKGISLRQGHGSLEVVWIEDVVIVDKHQEGSSRLRNPTQASEGQSHLLFADMSSLWMPGNVPVICNRIPGGIVDDQQLPLFHRQGLFLQSTQGAAQIVGPRVVCAEDY